MFSHSFMQTNHGESSNDKIKKLEKLKIKAEEVICQNNNIVNRIWTIDHQLHLIDFKKENSIESQDVKNKLLKEKGELEALWKKSHHEMKIKSLYSQIEKIEKELNPEFVRQPYFIR